MKTLWTEANTPSGDFVSEDPLGLVHLENQISTWLWPGFSSRTTRAGYYTMTTYGLWVAEAAAKRHRLPTTDDTLRALFQRWERLWAMAVCVYHGGEIPEVDQMRGLAGVQAAYRGRGKRTPLDYRLIARRRELGALGAYLTSLRDHRLVARDRLRVTPLGWELAQWMWDHPDHPHPKLDEAVIEALHPRHTTIPRQLTRSRLHDLGHGARLSTIRLRSRLQAFLWERLFAGAHRPAELAHLPEMAQILLESRRQGERDARAVLVGIGRDGWRTRCSPELKAVARLAVTFADLSAVLRAVFDRMYQAVLSAGHETEWGACVHAAITPEISSRLDGEVARWRGLRRDAQVAALSTMGRAFTQTMRRITTRNPYNLFESVLNLHLRAQFILGKGGGWIERQAESVHLRYFGHERWALDGTAWVPGFQMDAMASLLTDLGQLS